MSEQGAYRGAMIEVQLGLQWQASVYMPGSTEADPVTLYSDVSAGLEDVLLQARELVDQRITAAMTIMLQRDKPPNLPLGKKHPAWPRNGTSEKDSPSREG